MKKRLLLEDCANNWHATSSALTEIQGRIASLTTKLLTMTLEDRMTSQEKDGVLSVLKCLDSAETALSGLSYLCVPQAEWTGGAGSIMRAPHVVNG